MQFHINIVKAGHVQDMDLLSKSDPFIEIKPSFSKEIKRTKVILDDNSPEWDETFSFFIKNDCEDYFTLTLYDFDELSTPDKIGILKIYVKDFVEGEVVNKAYEMERAEGVREVPILFLKIQLNVRGRQKFVPYKIPKYRKESWIFHILSNAMHTSQLNEMH